MEMAAALAGDEEPTAHDLSGVAVAASEVLSRPARGIEGDSAMWMNVLSVRLRRWLVGPVFVVFANAGIQGLMGETLSPRASAAEPPQAVVSSDCTAPPIIDGVLGAGEWSQATHLAFDLTMHQLKPFAPADRRPCELHVMNSANTLYLALRLPAAVAHKSLSPLDVDLASVAFCRGADVAVGDDRRVVGIGFFEDKHVKAMGQDEADSEQSGSGAAGHDEGHYAIEWSVPLDGSDGNDLRARPGDEFRFNITFLDGYRPELNGTLGGGLYGLDLDHAGGWGTLRLAPGTRAAVPVKPRESAPITQAPGSASRPFLMGFTGWPSDMTTEGILTAQTFAHEHGDIVEVVFNGGIPWPEALEDKPFSNAVQEVFGRRPPAGKKLFLYIGALNSDRSGLVAYYGERDGLPLPRPWESYALNSPQVKRAYANFVLRAVREMAPDFLAIGIECNVLVSRSATKWKEYVELHEETYRAVKAVHPKLPVCFSTDVLHYKKIAPEARGTDQETAVAELMKHSDLMALSVYPHMSTDVARPVTGDFFDFARGFARPICVAETGDSSRDVQLPSFKVTLKGTEANQAQFARVLLETAAKDRYEFVIWTHTTDFEKLCEKLPPDSVDLARVWAWTGLQSSEKIPKPALAVWDAYLKLNHDRSSSGATSVH